MGTSTKSRLVFWLPPEEAMRRFGIGREELTAQVRTGKITMRAKVAGGKMQSTLCSTDLLALYGQPITPARINRPNQPVKGTPVQASAPQAELNKLLGELVAEKDRTRLLELDHARLEGRLETANRIERGLQRYADKLEQKLEDAELLRLNLARAVGQLEAEAQRLRARLEIAETPVLQLEAPVKTSKRPKKRSWFRR